MSTPRYGHPIFSWPLQPRAIASVFFGFPGLLWPWPILYLSVAYLQWYVVGNSIFDGDASLYSFAKLYLVNLFALVAFVLSFHYVLYVRRSQGLKYKYAQKWPEEKDRRYIFENEMLEGVLLSCISAVTVWTTYTYLLLWLYHNNILNGAGWGNNVFWYCIAFLLIPFWANIHFYFTHRFLHTKTLNRFHSVHHKASNISPWSGLSMHPVEHLIYFSAVPIFVFIVPTHPILMMYFMVSSALGPTTLHHGFAAIKMGNKNLMTDHHHHYLHHQFGRANYGATNLIPFDQWLKTDYQLVRQRAAKAQASGANSA